MFFLKLVLIPMLVKTLLTTRKPALCAGLYGAALFTNGMIFDWAMGTQPAKIALTLVGATGLSFAFFWALKEFEQTVFYWVTLFIGIPALLYFF